jgi:hypothetical protein
LQTLSPTIKSNLNQNHTKTCILCAKCNQEFNNIKFNSNRKKGWFNSTATLLHTRNANLDSWWESERGGKNESNSLEILQTSPVLNTFEQDIKIKQLHKNFTWALGSPVSFPAWSIKCQVANYTKGIFPFGF